MSRLVPIAAALVALTLVRAEPPWSQSMDVSRPAGTEAGGGHVEAESGPTTPSAGPHRGPEPEAESDRHPNGRDQIGGSARGAAGRAQSAPEPPGAVSPLQNELQTLYDAGKYAEAIPLAQQYLEESRSKFGDEHRVDPGYDLKAKLGESRSNILRIVEWIGKWCGVLVSGIADAWSAYPAFWVPSWSSAKAAQRGSRRMASTGPRV